MLLFDDSVVKHETVANATTNMKNCFPSVFQLTWEVRIAHFTT